ncbi:MAG: GNAT family N-acetyltransferase [Candidatus Bathyarchaeia archaeon]
MRVRTSNISDLTAPASGKWSKRIKLSDGTPVLLRPEVETDLEPLWEMFSSLSKETLRYLPIPFTRDRIEGWIENINYNTTLPILGIISHDGVERVIASATLSFSDISAFIHKAEFGITVHDDYQGMGLGTKLTMYMIDIAHKRGLSKIQLDVLVENHRAIYLYQKCGFRVGGKREMDHFNYITGKYGDTYIMGLILKQNQR